MFATVSPGSLAGPWPQDAGAWRETTTGAYERGDFGVSARQVYYLEVGVTSKSTAVLKIENLLRTQSGLDDRTAAQVGLNRGVWRSGDWSAAAGASFVFGESLLGDQCSGFGAEAHLGLGRSFKVAGRNAFAAIEGAHRQFGDDCARQKLDVVVGVDPAPKWRAYAKVFSDVGDGSNSLKGELLVTREIWGLALGGGYRREAGGAFNEEAFFLSVERDF